VLFRSALLPHTKEDATLDEKEELLHMAKGATVRGLTDNLREKDNKQTSDTCPHANTEFVTRCRDCGKWLR
jgi:hypothetical protein